VYTADILQTLDGGKVYVLHNKAWNKDEHVGDRLCIDFQGHGTGDITPVVTASINAGDVTPTPGADTSTTTASSTSTSTSTTSTTTTTTTTISTPTPSGSTPVPDATSTSTTHQTATDSVSSTTHRPTSTLAPSKTYEADMKVLYNYDETKRFYAEFSFTPDEDILGWIANVTFDVKSHYMESGTSVIARPSDDKLHYTMVSFGHTGYIKAGTTYTLGFFGSYYEQPHIPSGHAVLINMGRDKWTITPAATSDTSKYNYNDILYKSILFYEAQRAGHLPATNRIAYRGDSSTEDKGDNGEDLSGGWYVAHGHVKFNFPIAHTATVLAWGYLLYEDAYRAASQDDHLLDSVKWALDYLLKCHVSSEELYIQVSDAQADFWNWEQPEFMLGERPAYRINATHPGTDVAMETAAAFAAGSLAFKTKDPAYSATLLTHAKQLWEFGNKYHGVYSDSIQEAATNYSSHGYNDEICWASLWLYQATNDSTYLTAAEQHFDPLPASDMSWDNKTAANQLLLYKITKDDKYKTAVEGTFKYWFPGGSVQYTPKGLARPTERGGLGRAANMAMLGLIAADAGLHAVEYRHWAMCQIHYALGDTGFSYVVGFGDDYPLKPYQRISMCPNHPAICSPEILESGMPNVHILYGALVGGPGSNDDYADEFSNVNNDVSVEYNAGFQTAVAALKSLWLKSEHPEQHNNAQCPYTAGGPDVIVGRR
ncbi:hypothetical protein Btru_073121, partial [Bulinus truncatus]